MHAEILSIGDEITSGQTLDTNSMWLSGRLEEMGVRTLYHTTVGDELEPCVEVFRQAAERSDIVIATGGLGPTADDLTREALAKTVGRELILNPDALERIRSLFNRRKREMPKSNELQAMFPAGSRMIVNPNGTAPGIDLEIPREGRPPCRFFALPGVPAEMREMWDDYLRGEIGKLAGGANKIVRRKINCFGAGESQMEAMLPDMIRRGRQPKVGITAGKASISLRIDAEAATEEECQKLIEPTAKAIHECLGDLVFGEGDEELQHAVVKLLLEKRQTLGIVEWGTGGLVAELLAGVPGSEACFLGGFVAPSRMAFERHFKIDPASLCQTPAQLEAFYTGMTKSIRGHMQSDWLLMIGEIPTSDEANPPPVYFSIGGESGVKVKTVSFGIHLDLRKIFYAKWALNIARLAIAGR
jgi:nicotinamide-nucleotide amidase